MPQATEKKVALVTGCTEGGIGYYFCLKLLDRGYIVYATARSLQSMEPMDHPNARKLVLDVTSDEQVDTIVETVVKAEGQIDMAINNAGVILPGPFADITTEGFKGLLDVNVLGIHRVARTVIPHMAKRQQGMIMNVGSIAGEIPTAWMGAYECSKAAVKLLSEVLELECRPFNIKVMHVAPLAVATKIYRNCKDFNLPDTSIYKGFLQNIRSRIAHGMVQPDSMSADEFAEIVISKAVLAKPPFYIMDGGKYWLFKFLSWVPRSMMLNILWKRFSKPASA